VPELEILFLHLGRMDMQPHVEKDQLDFPLSVESGSRRTIDCQNSRIRFMVTPSAVSRWHYLVFVHAELPIASLRYFKPIERAGRGTVLHRAVGAKDAAVARAMKALIAGEVSHRASQVCADRAGYSESLVTIAKDEYLLFDHEGGDQKGNRRGCRS